MVALKCLQETFSEWVLLKHSKPVIMIKLETIDNNCKDWNYLFLFMNSSISIPNEQ